MKEVYCEKCGKRIFCNGVLGLRKDCHLQSKNIRVRKRKQVFYDFDEIPFLDSETEKLFCTCFECWQERLQSPTSEMFQIECWKGLQKKLKFRENPSYRLSNL